MDIAQATELEKWLVMPGEVITLHAEFEAECQLCHEPLAEGHVLTAYHHEILGGLFEWTTYQHDCDQCALKKMYEDGVEGVTKVNEAY